MIAYVLVAGVDYEGERPIGVYSTLENAKRAAATYLTVEYQYDDWISVFPVTLDGPAKELTEWDTGSELYHRRPRYGHGRREWEAV